MFIQNFLVIVSTIMLLTSSPFILIPAILIMVSTMMMLKWIQTNNPWMPLIFILAFLGGLMIMFMYVVSTLNKKQKVVENKMPLMILVVSMCSWESKWLTTSLNIKMMMNSFFSVYMILCIAIILILSLSTKLISSPFKSLKTAF